MGKSIVIVLHAFVGVVGVVGVVAAIVLSACSTAGAQRERWAYVGADEALGSPPQTAPAQERNEGWQQKLAQDIDAWQQRRRDATELAKHKCANVTGQGTTPGYVGGYGADFMACMRSQGWTRVSSPL